MRLKAIAALAILGYSGHASARPCRAPAKLMKEKPPVPLPMHRLVTRVESIRIRAPLSIVLESVAASRLEDTIQQQKSLPSVAATKVLTPGAFDYPGARRLVCLTDGSTLTEQVLEASTTPTESRFRYIVWNYTSATARPVRYGVGEFVRTALSKGETHVRWTYAFKMNRTRFPGILGYFGDWLFRWSFLDEDYARMMRATLAQGKHSAEQLAAAGHRAALPAR